MKVEVMAGDEKLFQLLEQKDPVFRVQQVRLPSSDADLLIISDQVVHYNELSEKLAGATYGKAFYLLSQPLDANLLKHVQTICETLGIHTVRSGLATEQIVERIHATVFPNETAAAKIVTFFSPLSNIGTTSVTLSTALAISKLTSAKVGVLGLNAWDDGTDQLPYKGEFLDGIKSRLSNRLLEANDDQILSYFFKLKKHNVYYLAGNQNIKMERLYSTQEIRYLIEKCRDLFDVLILDAGSHFDNANMLEALYEADLKFLIMNQQRKAIKKFNRSFRHVLQPLGYSLSDFSLIINRYSDETGIPSDKDMISEMGIPFIGKIPDVFFMGLHSEVQQNILYDYGADHYVQSIDFVAKTIINRAKLEVAEQAEAAEPKSKWRLFSKLGAGA